VYVDPLAQLSVFVPLNGDAVGSIFRRDSDELRKALGPDGLEPDQADPGEAFAGNGLWLKGRGEEAGKDSRIDMVVHQDAAVNYAAHDWNSHSDPPLLWPPNGLEMSRPASQG